MNQTAALYKKLRDGNVSSRRLAIVVSEKLILKNEHRKLSNSMRDSSGYGMLWYRWYRLESSSYISRRRSRPRRAALAKVTRHHTFRGIHNELLLLPHFQMLLRYIQDSKGIHLLPPNIPRNTIADRRTKNKILPLL